MLDDLDRQFHTMCRASKIADAPAHQLVDMYRAFNAGALALSKVLADSDYDGPALIAMFRQFRGNIETEEEIRRASP